MDYQLLRYIITVDKHQSISKAAEELYLTQPNISKAIKCIENEIGFQIFARTSRGVTTTQDGKEFIKKASKIVKGFDDFSKEFSTKNQPAFSLNIAHHNDIYFQELILSFSKNFHHISDLNINVSEGTSEEIIEMLLKEKINLGIICINEYDLPYYKRLLSLNNLDYEIKQSLKLKITCHTSNPISNLQELTKNDLINQTLITSNENDFYRYFNLKYKLLPSSNLFRTKVCLNQLALLQTVPNSYMISLPLSEEHLNLFNCKSYDLDFGVGNWTVIAIYNKNNNLTKLEHEFLDSM